MPFLGCIADDFTGATDLAGALTSNGMSATVMLGVPSLREVLSTEAIVVALKTRNAPAEEAQKTSLAALRWLRGNECERFYFKYCSTFDSTPRGNIGPVTEALMDEIGASFTVACPAFPENNRTVYKGYLFVGNDLLEESNMRFHPITPMTDSNLVRLLQAQTSRKVSLISFDSVCRGARSIEHAIGQERAEGTAIAIMDALSTSNLQDIARACRDLPLLTGGSALAGVLPSVLQIQERRGGNSLRFPGRVDGLSAVISGSCSATTQRQVAWMEGHWPTFRVSASMIAADPELTDKVLRWAEGKITKGPVLVAATAAPEAVREDQAKFGIEDAGRLVEDFLANISLLLVERGVRRLIIAGGETSGAVLDRLGVRSLRIGPRIASGVHWSMSEGEHPLALALKSGNFGADDMFANSWSLLA